MRINAAHTILLVTIALAGYANAGVGSNYNSRDPIACPSAQPKGAPTTAQATQIFRCTTEVETDHLYLTDNVQLQIGASRPFHVDNYPDIDSSRPVYPIRGSWTQYQCTNVKTYPGVGKNNCAVFDESNGSGICYQTTFGDWRCKMFPQASNLRPGRVPAPK